MGKLDNKVAIITGASSGVGKGTAIAFAEEGAKVVIVGRNKERMQQTADECAKYNAETLQVACDVTKMEELENLVKQVVDAFGTIDVLVNNAVTATQVVSIMDHTPEMWDSVMESGLHASWNLMRLCYPVMKEHKSGSIINLTSAAGLMSMPLYGAYAIAKSGIYTMTQVAAKEWAPDIRVNSIAPMAYSHLFDLQTPEWVAEFEKSFPLGYIGDAKKDVGPAMVFLASDDSRYITGQNLNVNGGIDIHM